MKKEYISRTTNRLLNLSLIFVLVYFVLTSIIISFPKLFGLYDLPFDIIHFASAAVKTVICIALCLVFRQQISQERSGGGFGVLLIMASYFACFILDWITGLIYSYRLSYLVSGYSSDIPIGQNLSVASYIANFCSYANVFFFTAVVLMIVAYGIWHTHITLQQE